MKQWNMDNAFRDGYWLDMQGILQQEQGAKREEHARANANSVVTWLKGTGTGGRVEYAESLIDAVEAGKRIGVCLRGKEVTDFKPKGGAP